MPRTAAMKKWPLLAFGLMVVSHLQVEPALVQAQVQPPAFPPAPESPLRFSADGSVETGGGEQSAARLIGQRTDLVRLEQRLRAILGKRLRLESSQGLRVYRLERAGRIIATLIVDDRRAGVLVEGAPVVLDQLEYLVEAISSQPAGAESRTAVVSIERTDRSQLQQAIDAYRRSLSNPPATPAPRDSSKAGYSTAGLRLVNFVLQDDLGTAADADARAASPQGSGGRVPIPAGGLDVDVDVQTLPDLDVIILRGRDRDVTKLTEIIQELERLSQETQPKVQVVQLRHVNSSSLARILLDVNEDLTGRRQGRVTTTPLVKPNAIMLIGWGDAVDAMISLIKQLDTEDAADSQFRVYRLKHAASTTVATTINQFFANSQGLGPRVLAVADVRSNAVVAYAAPRDLQELDQLVESLDSPQSDAVNRTKIIPIKHALASDIAQTLQTAIQSAAGQGAPSKILELLTIGADGERLLRSGILADVRITANPRTNALIVSGPPEGMPLLEALIEQLDAPSAVSQIKVFRIINGDAGSMVRMLRSLLPTDTAAGGAGPQLPAAADETSLVPLRFSVDTRTNSIIATGSDGDLRIIEALLLRLDERDLAERKNEVYRLRNSPAIDVASAINEFLRSERVVQLAAPGSESPFEQIEREVVVVPEPVGNSLIISATPRYFEE
ncbi:MAG: hypothetical protein KDA92_23330, partial [Planctomycetales bacterium]|nr:hypothetical protein [Planctomycetales bacterium]